MGEFFEKFGEGMRGFPKGNIGGRKLWGEILTGGNYGEVFLEILRGLAWISQKQYWREEAVGEFFLEIWRGFVWISKKQY